jgi:hypothetical protein
VTAAKHAPNRRLRLLSIAALAYALLACSACGAATPDSSREAGNTSRSATSRSATATAPAGASCAETVAATLGEIAKRIYHEASSGANVEQAVHRLRSSSTLASAISAGDATATRAALRGLLLGQIVRVEILRAGHPFASAGSGSAIAPVSGTIPGTGASFVLSVQADRTYLQVTRQVTGAELLLLAGDHRLGGTIDGVSPEAVPATGKLTLAAHDYEVFSLPASSYPSGAIRIAVLVPSQQISCPAAPERTRAEVLGKVGERIYDEEARSPYVAAKVRRMEASTAFRTAVAANDVTATRRAIIGFFAAHIHVVRVRVTVGAHLLIDLGGPHVLAPVAGTLRSGGKVIGHFLMAIQDDAGYLRLAHLFTGGEVLMRTGSEQVAATLAPGPASVPDRGPVSYRGHSYEAYSFTGRAFPSGPLRISLLF